MSGLPHYLLNSEARTFVRDQDRIFNKYDFYTCVILDSLSQSIGEVDSSYHIDPNLEGNFIEVAVVKGAKTRSSMSMVGRLPRHVDSVVYALADKQKLADIQLHFGRCYNPSIFNEFDSALVLEDVSIVDYNTDRMGAMGMEETAIITETTNISIGQWYYLRKLAYNNIGLTILNDGYEPISMDVLDGEFWRGFSNDQGIIFVLAYHSLNALTQPLRVYFTLDRGRNWASYDLPLAVYDPTLIVAQQTTISAFQDYVYLHIRISTGFSSQSKIFSIPTLDLINQEGIWSVVATGEFDDQLQAQDRIVKFKDNYYAAYFEGFNAAATANGRVVRYGSTVGAEWAGVYYGGGNDVATPYHLVNYQDQILFSGMYQHPNDGSSYPIFIGYSEDGTHWHDVPIKVNGIIVSLTGVRDVYVVPINDKQWHVYVRDANGNNLAYSTSDGGIRWRSIAVAFSGMFHAPYWHPTNSVLYTPTQRSYDGGISAVSLPDNGGGATYTTTVDSFPSLHGTAQAICFGYRHDPNLMFTYGTDGVHIFS